MKVYNRVVIDIASGRIEDEDSYEYDGPVAKCGDFGYGGDPAGPNGAYGGTAAAGGDYGGDPYGGPGGNMPYPNDGTYRIPNYSQNGWINGMPNIPPAIGDPAYQAPDPTFTMPSWNEQQNTVLQSGPYAYQQGNLYNANSQMQPYWDQASGALNNYGNQQQQFLGNLYQNQQQYSNLALPNLQNQANTLQGYINRGLPYEQQMMGMIDKSQASAAGLQNWITGLQGNLGAGGGPSVDFYGGPLKDYLDKLQGQGLQYAPQQEALLKQMGSQDFFRQMILPEMQTAMRGLGRGGLPSSSYADAALSNTLGSLFNKNQLNTLQGYQNLGSQMQNFQNNLAGGYGKYGDIGNAYGANQVGAAGVGAKIYGDQLAAITGGYSNLDKLYGTGLTGGTNLQGNWNTYQGNMLKGLGDVNTGYRDYGTNMGNFGTNLANQGNIYGNNITTGWNQLGANVGQFKNNQGNNMNSFLNQVNLGVNTAYRPDEWVGNQVLGYS